MFEQILTPRTTAVVTPEQLASFGRFDVSVSSPPSVDYEMLQLFIEAATDQVEQLAAQACLNEELELSFDFFPGTQDPRNMLGFYQLGYAYNVPPWWWYGFPTKDSIELVRRPVVTSLSPLVYPVVKYDDPDGNEQTWNSSNYEVSCDKIRLKVGLTWPQTDRKQDCIRITYIAGYHATDPTKVPARLRLAVLYLAAHFWSVRDVVAVEPTSEIGMTLKSLLQPFRSMRIPR